MVRPRLLLVSALCSVACAQIAGFDQLSSRKTEATEGGSGSETAGASSIGGSAGAGRGPVPASAGESTGGVSTGGASAGGSGNGGKSSSTSGGNASSAGSPSSGGSQASAGSAPTAGSGGAAGAAVIGGCNAQLLKNAAFDAGPVDWRQESKAPGILEVSDLIVDKERPALVQAGVMPQAGNYLAWLGGVLDSDKGSKTNLLQDVEIPAKVSKLVLSGFLQIKTTEPNPNETTDQLDLTLQDDTKYWSFHFWKGTELTNGWQAFSYEFSDAKRLDALRGRTLTFYAESIADTSEITSYWLDSISLFAQCAH